MKMVVIVAEALELSGDIARDYFLCRMCGLG